MSENEEVLNAERAETAKQDWLISPCCGKAVYDKGNTVRCSQCHAACPSPGGWLVWNNDSEGWEGGTGFTRAQALAAYLHENGYDADDIPPSDLSWRALPAGLSETGDYELFILTSQPFAWGSCEDIDRRIETREDVIKCLTGAKDEDGDDLNWGFWNSGEADWTKRRLVYGADALREFPEKILRADLAEDARFTIALEFVCGKAVPTSEAAGG